VAQRAPDVSRGGHAGEPATAPITPQCAWRFQAIFSLARRTHVLRSLSFNQALNKSGTASACRVLRPPGGTRRDRSPLGRLTPCRSCFRRVTQAGLPRSLPVCLGTRCHLQNAHSERTSSGSRRPGRVPSAPTAATQEKNDFNRGHPATRRLPIVAQFHTVRTPMKRLLVPPAPGQSGRATPANSVPNSGLGLHIPEAPLRRRRRGLDEMRTREIFAVRNTRYRTISVTRRNRASRLGVPKLELGNEV
jgi:hypothetical protein